MTPKLGKTESPNKTPMIRIQTNESQSESSDTQSENTFIVEENLKRMPIKDFVDPPVLSQREITIDLFDSSQVQDVDDDVSLGQQHPEQTPHDEWLAI